MLRIIRGGLYSTAHEDIVREILEKTALGERVLLLVPEQESVIAETEITPQLSKNALLNFEVINFSRLADKVFREVGGLAGEYSDKARDALIMWRVLTELAPVLHMTNSAPVSATLGTAEERTDEITIGLVTKALSAYNEIRALSLSPDELLTLADSDKLATNVRLKKKLQDIAHIATTYKKLHSERFADVGDSLELLAKKLTEHPEVFKGVSIYIEGFTSFTEPQYKILAALNKSTALTAVLPMSKLQEGLFEFSEIKNTQKRLKDDVARGEVSVSDAKISYAKSQVLREVYSLLWQPFEKLDRDTDIKDAVRIFEAQDPYEEASFICADIKRKIMAGASARDFAIIAASADKYLGIIDTALEDAALPYFISKKKGVSSFEAIKLIFTAMKIVENDRFAREDVISYIKCALSDITEDECDEFELYTEIWQITGRRFYDRIEWNMSPSGYSTRRASDEGEVLSRINRIRDTVISPLEKYSQDRKEAHTVAAHAAALYNFLCELQLEKKIYGRCDELAELGEADYSAEAENLWKIICRALDTLVSTLGDTKIDGVGFENLLRVVLSIEEIGKIPAHYDEITVGSADMIRVRGKKHIYLLGVNAGEFPASPKENSYFTDKDKALLNLIDSELKLDTGAEIAYARELFSFSRAFSYASESVTLLYSLRDEGFASCAPSDVIARIGEMTKKKVVTDGVEKEVMLTPVKISSLALGDRIYCPAAAIDLLCKDGGGEIKKALCEVGYKKDVEISGKSVKNESLTLGNITKSIYNKDLALTQSMIDKYVSCPFSYYLGYNLRLSENERAEFDSANVGTFIHSILETFFKGITNPDELKDMTPDVRERRVHDAAEDFLKRVAGDDIDKDKRLALQLSRLKDAVLPVVEGLCDELANCKYVPKFFELKIESEKEKKKKKDYVDIQDTDERPVPSPTPAIFDTGNGECVYIYGAIDRVDTYKCDGDVYVRIIDYKTGSKTFSPDDIDKGKNLQMFLYLKSIVESQNPEFLCELGVEDGGSVIPGGVIYVNTDMSDVKIAHADKDVALGAIKANQKRRGMILNDKESIDAMSRAHIPVRIKSNGDPHASDKKFLYTREEWDGIMDRISNKITEISRDMRCGKISTSENAGKKKDNPCDYCKFKPICRTSGR